MTTTASARQASIEFIDLKTQYKVLKHEIDSRIQRVLDHGQYILGPEVKELEAALCELTGARHCITCASGTEALLMALMALDIGPGHEVITTPFTFAATAEMIVLLGATPVFVDVEPGTGLMDSRLVEAAITERTRAIMPVSLYGQVCDMDAINAIARRHGNLPVIEDAAQSFGATYRGESGVARHSGHLSTIGCTSFFPSKPLGCYGDGGALFTDDDQLAQALREIRVHGQSKRYVHTRIGLGGRMDTLQCAVVLAKLTRFDWEIQRRKALGERYRQRLTASGAPVQLLHVPSDRDCVWAQYTVMVDQREALQTRLAEQGIPTAVHYPIPLHLQPAYQHLGTSARLPHSTAISQRVMSLPMSADLTDELLDHIVEVVAECLQA
jgi:UDP-2-acetamido-2-deoxy-ribo-hexuluronate aminotransferase